MAETRAVWGIDIGQAGLKAIRLKYAEAADQVLAVAFDYVPHPKILSQPDAVPDELIAEALEKFLSRNDVRGDVVVIGVPGQLGFTRFIKLPPVDPGKMDEIVKYEARQQIPFALEDVIWEWQPLGGIQEGDFLLDAEVGLFAMKKEDVARQLRPYNTSKVEVDLIQMGPLALYNFLAYDRLGVRPDQPSTSDEYHIVLDLGADNTTLIISNGARIWIRNVPIGGNHFTRALTKEMKLTFAKAEHLKCNATKSPDPRAVFQALRPVFNDYVSQIQLSIGYFSSVNRDAKITKILGLGNGFKLAGLQKFLQQNLSQYEVERVESFQGLVGDAVLKAPLFEENLLSFGVPYGLALQGLQLTTIRTDLLPREIKTARIIRKKKPWAVATAATLLVGLALSVMGYAKVNASVSETIFGKAEAAAKKVASDASTFQTNYKSEEAAFQAQKDKGKQLLAPVETRDYWLEVYKAINESLPRDNPPDKYGENEITKKNRIRIWNIHTQKVPDLALWYASLTDTQKAYYMRPDDAVEGPTGEGYLFTLQGVHYHHEKENSRGQLIFYVVDTLLHNLKEWEISRPGPVGFDKRPTPVRAIGITHPVIVQSSPEEYFYFYPGGKRLKDGWQGDMAGPGAAGGMAGMNRLPGARDMMGAGRLPPAAGGRLPGGVPPMVNPGIPRLPGGPTLPGAAGRPGVGFPLRSGGAEEKQVEAIEIPLTKFMLQFVWQPVPKEKRAVQDVIYHFLKANPEGTFDDLQKFAEARKIRVEQADFDEFVKKNKTYTTKTGAVPAAASVAPPPAAGGAPAAAPPGQQQPGGLAPAAGPPPAVGVPPAAANPTTLPGGVPPPATPAAGPQANPSGGGGTRVGVPTLPTGGNTPR